MGSLSSGNELYFGEARTLLLRFLDGVSAERVRRVVDDVFGADAVAARGRLEAVSDLVSACRRAR